MPAETKLHCPKLRREQKHADEILELFSAPLVTHLMLALGARAASSFADLCISLGRRNPEIVGHAPCSILDCFSGTGTGAYVAQLLGMPSLSLDMVPRLPCRIVHLPPLQSRNCVRSSRMKCGLPHVPESMPVTKQVPCAHVPLFSALHVVHQDWLNMRDAELKLMLYPNGEMREEHRFLVFSHTQRSPRPPACHVPSCLLPAHHRSAGTAPRPWRVRRTIRLRT